MSETRGTADWDRAAMITAAVINMHRDPKKGRPATPAALNPYRAGKDRKDAIIKLNQKDSMAFLKQIQKQL